MRFVGLKLVALLTLAAVCAPVSDAGYSGRITLNKADGIYKVGDKVVCEAMLFKDGKPLKGELVRLIMRWEGKNIKVKEFIATGEPVSFSYRSGKPGWLYFGFQVMESPGKPRRGKGVDKHPLIARVVEAGAMFEPEKIRYTVARPADFAKFWAKRKAEVAEHDLKPELTELDSGIPGMKLFAVSLSCPRGIKATGYLAYPENASPKSLPACLSYLSWANTDASRNSALGQARRGAVAFAATWHGLPVNQPAGFYAQLNDRIKGGLPGVDNRDKWIMGEIYFRVLCELKYLKSRPEWDGRTLVSIGGSLGGAQSVAAAALDPDVTTAVVNVPCFCEFDGAAVGRRGSIPRQAAAKTPTALRELNYFDCVSFAPDIKCETFVCTGFSDEACNPSSVYAFYNALPQSTKKTMSTDPFTGHFGTTRNTRGDARLKALFEAIKIGEIPKDVK